MVPMPAVCKNCGAVYSSGININNSTNVMLSDNKVTCPRCGHWGTVVEGWFDVTDDVIVAIRRLPQTRPELLRILQVLEWAVRERVQDVPTLERKLKADAPEGLSLLSLLRDPAVAGITGIIGLIIIMLQLVLSGDAPPAAPRETVYLQAPVDPVPSEVESSDKQQQQHQRRQVPHQRRSGDDAEPEDSQRH